MARIGKILIANRGEIALRVMRSARALGIKTVAVYSAADADTPHVQFADEAVALGGETAAESYLDIKKILAGAKASRADAIHPGYGFLSENAAFARAVTKAGYIFIGPPAQAIALMGNKARAKRAMMAAGVPCVAGYQDAAQNDAALRRAGARIGYPLMVKAAAGGGGRGMRLVERAADLSAALRIARSEAKSAFGSDALILEQALMGARHVEIQIFADTKGHVVHMGERDCSVQRRHQKIIEEAPCPVMTQALRTRMGEAACTAARAIGYVGAGTVEFLLDAKKNFYFLEMNTRLQVEHPVTEAVTGLDLVALQIQVAQGEALGLAQDDIILRGAAIEVRLYAEDPSHDFLPATGRILRFDMPPLDGVRYDVGIREGQEVSAFYDPMLAKIIAWGDTRSQARARLMQALRALVLFGVPHNRDFLLACLAHPIFAKGRATTNFIADAFGSVAPGAPTAQTIAAISILQYLADATHARAQSPAIAQTLYHFTNAPCLTSRYQLKLEGGADDQAALVCMVQTRTPTHYQVHCGADSFAAKLLHADDGHARLQLGEQILDCVYLCHDGLLHCAIDGQSFVVRNLLGASSTQVESAGSGQVLAPMHGRVIAILVKSGAKVVRGQRLAIIEAMKMQHEILAPLDGKVKAIYVKLQEQLAADIPILELEPA